MSDADLRELEREYANSRDPAVKSQLIPAYARIGRWVEWRTLLLEDYERVVAEMLPERTIRRSLKSKLLRRTLSDVLASVLVSPIPLLPDERRLEPRLEVASWAVVSTYWKFRKSCLFVLAYSRADVVTVEARFRIIRGIDFAIDSKKVRPDSAWPQEFPNWRMARRETHGDHYSVLGEKLTSRLRRWASKPCDRKLRLSRDEAAGLRVALLGRVPGREHHWKIATKVTSALSLRSFELIDERRERDLRKAFEKASDIVREEMGEVEKIRRRLPHDDPGDVDWGHVPDRPQPYPWWERHWKRNGDAPRYHGWTDGALRFAHEYLRCRHCAKVVLPRRLRCKDHAQAALALSAARTYEY